MSKPSKEAVELPEGMRRLSPTVKYQQFRGQGYKPVGVMQPDPEGGYVDAAILIPRIEAQTLDRVREALLNDDGPVLLTIREALGEEMEGRGWRHEDGAYLHVNGPEVEAVGDAVSDRVKAVLSTFDQQGGEDGE